MLMTDYERKQYIDDLQKTTNEREIIDFLRNGFDHEYQTVFEKEMDERIKMAIEKIKYSNKELENFDIRWYTLRVLRREMATELDIRSDYMKLEELKIILFFEHLINTFDNSKENNIEKNQKIKESRNVYSFFRGLIANGNCNLSKFRQTINLLGLGKLEQDDFDNDIYHNMHDFVEKLILDKYLLPFIDEYKNML